MYRVPINLQSDAPQLGDVQEDQEQLVVIFYWFIALILAGLVAGIFITLSNGNVDNAFIDGLSTLPVLFSLYFVRRRMFEPAAAFIAVVLMTSITFTATNGLGIHHPGVLGYGAILIVASLVTRTRTLLVLLGYNLLCAAWLVFGELLGWYIPGRLVRSVPGDFFTVTIILILTAVMVRMITETMFQNALRLRAELRERQIAEAKYRAIFDNAIDGIFQSTPTGQFVNVNPAMARMYGYDSPADMLARVTDIAAQLYVDPEHRKALRARLAAGEKINNFESLDLRKDGSTFWTAMNVQTITDERGQALYYEGTVEDITPRKLADEALRQFKAIMDDSYDAIFIVDPVTSRYKYFNERARLLLGYSADELLTLSVIDIATHITDMHIWHERADLVRLSNGVLLETFYRRKDGSTFPVEVSARSLTYGGEEMVVAFVRDITERRRAEQERERLIQELANKNTELERFTYTVSHDLKAPLVTIRGFLGYLEKDALAGNAEKVSHDVARINGAVDKMHDLLNDLLELSRIGRLMNEPETIPLNDLVNDALDIVHGRLTARHITVQTQPNLPLVRGDRRRLTEVLQNLLDNAAKFMGNQPEPRIRVGQRGTDPATGDPVFFVQDNGLGIAPEHHDRVFGLFNKLDAKTEGTGIGLALVRRIIEFHGGRIWVESAEGQGATFCFSLVEAGRGESEAVSGPH